MNSVTDIVEVYDLLYRLGISATNTAFFHLSYSVYLASLNPHWLVKPSQRLYRSSPYWAVFMQKQCFPHRWSSRILRIAVPFLAHPLDVIQSLDMYFSSCTRGLKKDPLMW